MPKKGSKKGGGKGSGMTEEERLISLHQKEAMLTQFLKDKLQKEEKNTAVNLHKLTQQWRAFLRPTRAAELRRDIDIASQTFERVLDRKDSVIKCLVSDFSEAEQQSGRALCSHLHCLDSLLDLQTGRLAFLEQVWQNGRQELGSEFNTEREYISSLHQRECSYFEDVTFAMEQHCSEVDYETRQDYLSTRDDIKTRHIAEKHALMVQLESMEDGLRRQEQNALQSFNEATAHHRNAYESLCGSVKRGAQEIDMHMNKLQRMHDSISTLRLRLSNSPKESEAAAQELRTTIEGVTQQVRQLEAQHSRARASDRNRLASLTIQSNAATKKLQGIISKGEKLLRLAEMCRKLETEHEKVLPFYTSSLTTEEQTKEKLKATKPPFDELAKVMLDYSDLERFWQRYNRVLLEQLCLEKEKEVLTRENQQLQDIFRRYMDGISVSEIHRRQKPLLIVSMIPVAERRRKQHTHVIEAGHVIQHTL